MLKGKKRYVLLGAVGLLALLLGGVGIAYAQGPQPPRDGQSFSRGGRFLGGAMLDDRPFNGGPMRGGAFRGGPVQGLVGVTAEVTGLSEGEVIAALEDGQTIAEIAESEGVDPQEIADAAIAEAETRLEEAVENGQRTEEQMDQMLERLAEDLPHRLEQPWQPSGPMGGVLGQFGEGFWTVYDAVAEVLDLTPEELFSNLHDGKSVGGIAEEQGVEMDAVRDAMEAAQNQLREKTIEQAVEDGRMSRERADWLLEGLEEGFLRGGRDLDGGRGGRPGHGGPGRGMGW